MFIGFLSWRQSIDDIGFILLLCIRYPHCGIFPLCYEILSRGWVMWLSLILIIEMFDWCYEEIDWCWQMFGWRCHVFYCVPNIHIGAYFPLFDEIVHRWMIIVGCLPYDFDIKYPYWGIFPSPWWYFVCAVVWRWIIGVVYLSHDLDIRSFTGAYFLIFFKYSWDWANDQLGFRLSTSIGLSMIDCIRTSLHGFVEIEMDHIKLHPRSMGGSFSQMLMR